MFTVVRLSSWNLNCRIIQQQVSKYLLWRLHTLDCINRFDHKAVIIIFAITLFTSLKQINLRFFGVLLLTVTGWFLVSSAVSSREFF